MQADHLLELNSTSTQLREVCFERSHCLVNTFSKDEDLICYVVNFMRSSGKLQTSLSCAKEYELAI
jgi:golgin subfamily B member 1